MLDDARLHVLARGIGAGVHVGDETDGGHGVVYIGWKSGIEIAKFVKFNLLQAFSDKFLL